MPEINKQKFLADFPQFTDRLQPFEGKDLYDIVKTICESSANVSTKDGDEYNTYSSPINLQEYIISII